MHDIGNLWPGEPWTILWVSLVRLAGYFSAIGNVTMVPVNLNVLIWKLALWQHGKQNLVQSVFTGQFICLRQGKRTKARDVLQSLYPEQLVCMFAGGYKIKRQITMEGPSRNQIFPRAWPWLYLFQSSSSRIEDGCGGISSSVYTLEKLSRGI